MQLWVLWKYKRYSCSYVYVLCASANDKFPGRCTEDTDRVHLAQQWRGETRARAAMSTRGFFEVLEKRYAGNGRLSRGMANAKWHPSAFLKEPATCEANDCSVGTCRNQWTKLYNLTKKMWVPKSDETNWDYKSSLCRRRQNWVLGDADDVSQIEHNDPRDVWRKDRLRSIERNETAFERLLDICVTEFSR